MTEREEVIDIERNETIVIEVNNTGETAAVVNQVSIFAAWKRVAMGVSIILLLVVPIIGGTVSSYFFRRALHKPTDPYNIWPDTEYRGPDARVQGAVVDQGYSSAPNNYFLIKNDAESYFTVKNDPDPEMYMAVYLVENLFDNKSSYGLHVISSTDKNNLKPLKDISSARHPIYITLGMDHGVNDGIWQYYHSGPFDVNLANYLGQELSYKYGPASFGNQEEVCKYIAASIRDALLINNTRYYYPTGSKSASYLMSSYGDYSLSIGVLSKLQKLRNETREAEEKKKPAGSKGGGSGPTIKSKFKKLKVQTLTQLSA